MYAHFILDHVILLGVVPVHEVVADRVIEAEIMLAALDDLKLAERDGIQVAGKKVQEQDRLNRNVLDDLGSS